MKKAYIFLTITAILFALLLGFWLGRNWGGDKTVIHISSEDSDRIPVSGKLNINAATVQELDALPGIGIVLGNRIVEYRNTYGPFTDISQILNIEGISQNLYMSIQDYIYAGDTGKGPDG